MSVKTDTPAECTLQKQACGVGSTHRAPGKRFGGTREHAIATPGMLVPQLWAWSLLLLSAFHLSSAMQANANNKSMLCMWPVGSKYWREACKMLRLFSPFKFFFFFFILAQQLEPDSGLSVRCGTSLLKTFPLHQKAHLCCCFWGLVRGQASCQSTARWRPRLENREGETEQDTLK